MLMIKIIFILLYTIIYSLVTPAAGSASYSSFFVIWTPPLHHLPPTHIHIAKYNSHHWMNHVFNYSLTLKAVNQLYLNPLIALSPSKQMDGTKLQTEGTNKPWWPKLWCKLVYLWVRIVIKSIRYFSTKWAVLDFSTVMQI